MMQPLVFSKPANSGLQTDLMQIQSIIEENQLLRQEIRVAREAAQITADLVVKQFEETEKILQRFQVANAQRKAVLNSAANIAIIAANEAGIITVFNTGAENLLGYSADEVIGISSPVIFHPAEELQRHGRGLNRGRGRPLEGVEIYFAYTHRGMTEEQEWIFIRKDGVQIPVNMSINALRESDGSVSGFLLIAHDISQQKLSEKALKESERNYRLLVKNLPNVVFKGYADGTIDFVDDRIEILTGYPKDEFLLSGKKWLDVVVAEDLDLVRRRFIQGLKSADKTYMREYRIRSKSGDEYWIEEGGQIICDEAGKIEFVIGAFLNITERKMAEQALYESEEKYRSLFYSGPNPIVVLDKDSFEILDANPRAEELYRSFQAELKGKKFTELGTFEFDDRSAVQIDQKGWLEEGIIIQKLRTPQTDQSMYIRIKVSPTIYKGKDAIILAGTDITEMIEKDALLIHASKMTTLGEMSAGIAHELNQPLNAIKIGNDYISTMIDAGKCIPDQDLFQVVNEVNSQVERASDIINRLRAFGRKMEPTKERVNVNAPVIGVLKMLGQQLKLESIQVHLDLQEDLPAIMAQHNRLEQILFNLITNARDAINQKKIICQDHAEYSISISTFQKGDRVGISIADTGIGIPEEIRSRIFEPFFTTKEVGNGMGLGLAIIYGIIRDYGGEIDVRSQEGKGTIFVYTFPVVQS